MLVIYICWLYIYIYIHIVIYNCIYIYIAICNYIYNTKNMMLAGRMMINQLI